jgi:prepilin-type N-terminal cleavage/methylation domain-containing protein
VRPRRSVPAPCTTLGRRGFTLVEVMVALVVSAFVLASARAVLGELSDAERRTRSAARAADGDANAQRALRALFDRVETGIDPATGFGGDGRSARFRSWCDVPHGWAESCQVHVKIDSANGVPVVVAAISTGEVLVLRRHFTRAELLYLADPSDGGRWVTAWGTGLAVPAAVALVVDADTTILRIGERG